MRGTIAAAIMAPLLAAAPAGPTLGEIKVQLYYKTTGTLSANIAPPAKFDAWNTGAGEGDTREPAEDMVISVPIRPAPGSDTGVNSEIPLTITARNAAGKVLGTRTFKFISIPYRDPVISPLWLNDIQCAGAIAITAAWGKQVRKTKVSMDCGE